MIAPKPGWQARPRRAVGMFEKSGDGLDLV